MAAVFYKSNYNITKLFDHIFTSKWFYNEANIGTRIKSPIELFVGIQRTLPLSFENRKSLLTTAICSGSLSSVHPTLPGGQVVPTG